MTGVIQEVGALLYLPRLPAEIKESIYLGANASDSCLAVAVKFEAAPHVLLAHTAPADATRCKRS